MKTSIAAAAVLASASLSPAALVVTNGDFESPDISTVTTNVGDQVQDVPSWFDATVNYQTWWEYQTAAALPRIQADPVTGYSPSQHVGMRGDGYLYQSLGTTEAGDVAIDWSFFQGRYNDNNSSAGFSVVFYVGNGTFTGADGTNIATAGLTQIGTTASFAALGNTAPGNSVLGRINSGMLDISGLPAGSQVWMAIFGTGGASASAPLDNVAITVVTSVPAPAAWASGGLLMGALAMGRRRRR